MSLPSFAARVARWQRAHGRHGLPWQGTRDAYRIWVAEVMLQQTQVATVLPYYGRFLARFPDVAALAGAPVDAVLGLWSGLGYYARARNLHAAAQQVVARFGVAFPSDFDSLVTLPGIGRSTAAAIAAFAAGERRAILEANVKRVIARHAGVAGDPGNAAVLAQLWAQAEARLPARGIERYTQGMMDLGALLCAPRQPACPDCPVAGDCVARLEGRVDELPGRRPRVERPRRAIGMLVIVARGEVLLERRPPRGIWGGLWSAPEIDATAVPAEALARDWGIADAAIEPLAPFAHAFTHFTLEVAPWRARLRRAPGLAPGRPATWLALAELDGAALPSPVRRLLRSVA